MGLIALLVATAVMYLWDITINRMGNQFYAAAAQAGSTNWEALLFGSLDPHNFITVDKPPVSQWVMGLSGQIFGFSSASMLVPQALMAVAAVALLYGAVPRISGPRAGLLAGAVLALTPVAALMFRFNNPDAVMVLLMTGAAYCTVRALQQASARWLALAGVALGFAFLAKMLEGLMVAPALAAAYLVAAPTPLRPPAATPGGCRGRICRLGGLVCGADAVVAGVVAAVHRGFDRQQLHEFGVGLQRVCPGSRPQPHGIRPARRRWSDRRRVRSYISGGTGGFGGFGDQSQGWSRLFAGEFGFEIGWLVPGRAAGDRCWSCFRARTRAADRPDAGRRRFCSVAGCWSTGWC